VEVVVLLFGVAFGQIWYIGLPWAVLAEGKQMTQEGVAESCDLF